MLGTSPRAIGSAVIATIGIVVVAILKCNDRGPAAARIRSGCVLTTSREDFETFWRQRQALFETTSEKLYGMSEIVRAAKA